MGAARPFRQAGEMWCWQDSKGRVCNTSGNGRVTRQLQTRFRPRLGTPVRLGGRLIPGRLLGRLPRPWRRVLDWVVTIAVAIALVLVFEAEIAKPYRVPSASMEPTLHCAKPARGCQARFSDRVIALRIVYRFRDPHRGEIAVFHAPATAADCGESGSLIFVKRVIGLPGETVQVRDKKVSINGTPLNEPYTHFLEAASTPSELHEITSFDVRERYGPVTVPANQYFVMGDNRDNSQDSRYWGFLRRDYIKGKALVIYWSYEGGREDYQEGTTGDTLRGLGSTFAHFFTRTRWDRMFHQIR
jgi:signal peptidase I